MNDKPHTHRLELETKLGPGNYAPYNGSSFDPVFVKYGDTRVRVCWWFQNLAGWSEDKRERRIRKATNEAIRNHDEGSRQAGLDAAAKENAWQHTRQVVAGVNGVLLGEREVSVYPSKWTGMATAEPTIETRRVPRDDVWGSDLPMTVRSSELRVVNGQ